MALHRIVAVRDIQIEEFLRPFTTPAIGGATRSFTDEVNRVDRENPMNQHPADYHLYELGTFDTSTGEIQPLPSPGTRLLLRGEDAVSKSPSN